MIYLLGTLGAKIEAEVGDRPDFGYITSPKKYGRVHPRALWGADNGCFSDPESYDTREYMEWLDGFRAPEIRGRCLFVTAPDVVGDHAATWEKSVEVLPKIRERGFPAALVAQDGLYAHEIAWHLIDVLFIGGSTEWKLSETAFHIAEVASRKGKWVHMGRVNSLRRIKAARISKFDSVDGNHIAYGRDKKLPELMRWMERVNKQGIFNQ